MKIVIFGLTISSSWGNGHATLWRGLVSALTRKGCRITFFERDVPYYAGARDLHEITGGELILYPDWNAISGKALREIRQADAVVITSYCPDGIAAAELAAATPGLQVFYDLDSPVTLAALNEGKKLSYIGPGGLSQFDIVLSYTGGAALEHLKTRMRARRVAALYGHVDPEQHKPSERVSHYASDLSYLGTYAADRQSSLERLFVEPAAQRPGQRFLIGGAQYPHSFPWLPNVFFVQHLPPDEHPAFYSSSRLTLNVTRAAMMQMGWCPSGRLFEAASCGTAIASDAWEGIEAFYEPGIEILLARTTEDVLDAMDLSDREIAEIAAAGKERTLSAHTSDHRAEDFLQALWPVESKSDAAVEAI